MIKSSVEEGYLHWNAQERDLREALWSIGPEGRIAALVVHVLSEKLTKIESALYDLAGAEKRGSEMIRLSAPGFGLVAKEFKAAATASEAAAETLRATTRALLERLAESHQASTVASARLVRATWALCSPRKAC